VSSLRRLLARDAEYAPLTCRILISVGTTLPFFTNKFTTTVNSPPTPVVVTSEAEFHLARYITHVVVKDLSGKVLSDTSALRRVLLSVVS